MTWSKASNAVAADLSLEKIEGEQHVGCTHRYAVRKPRPRVEAEDDVGMGIVGLDRLGDQAIECEGFIEGAQHQRLEYVADETLRRGSCTQVIRIEAVERPFLGERQMASFRRLRIGVGKAREVGGQRRLAMHSNGVGRQPFVPRRVLRAGGASRKQQKHGVRELGTQTCVTQS